MLRLRTSALLLALLLLAPRPAAAAQLGDAGHFLTQFAPPIHLQNPDGEAFTVTLHRYIWPHGKWNSDFRLAVVAPDGETRHETVLPAEQGSITLRVPAGAAGVYGAELRLGGYGLCWLETSLPRLVAGCADLGPLAEGEPGYRPLLLHAMLPRRWYFYVPPETERFEVQQVIGTWQSHREDYGVVVMNPRGQRVAALYGGLSIHEERLETPRIVRRTVETDPGARGRFWSLWVTGGDSHSFTDMRLVLKGVPPYAAPTPEQWFDPETGRPPPRLLYDESPIRHVPEGAQPDPQTGRRPSVDFYKWAPVPYLGDEDYNGIRGAATVLLWNPENRSIDVGAGSYLVAEMPVVYTLTGPRGKRLFRRERTFTHKGQYFVTIPPRGPGVYRMEIAAPSWYAWSRPAVPMMLEGARTETGARFRLQISIARHWYFRVPEGTDAFTVRAGVADPEHVLALEIHAPDRLVEPLYVRGGEPRRVRVRVPEGLDGTVWFLRTDVGSPTRFFSEDPEAPRHARLDAEIILDGVPGYLAPSWGQWFDPDEPARR